MPLYIKDMEVDALTSELVSLKKTSKVEAVKLALRHEIERHRRELPLRERLSRTLALAREIGPFAPGDHKKDMDEQWGEP